MEQHIVSFLGDQTLWRNAQVSDYISATQHIDSNVLAHPVLSSQQGPRWIARNHSKQDLQCIDGPQLSHIIANSQNWDQHVKQMGIAYRPPAPIG